MRACCQDDGLTTDCADGRGARSTRSRIARTRSDMENGDSSIFTDMAVAMERPSNEQAIRERADRIV